MDAIKKYNIKKEGLQRTVDFLKAAISTLDEFLELLEKNKGWFPLNNQAIGNTGSGLSMPHKTQKTRGQVEPPLV